MQTERILIQPYMHTPEGLVDKFRDLLLIFKSAAVSKEDTGPHMAQFCNNASVESQPWMALISSYFARLMLIPTPLLR